MYLALRGISVIQRGYFYDTELFLNIRDLITPRKVQPRDEFHPKQTVSVRRLRMAIWNCAKKEQPACREGKRGRMGLGHGQNQMWAGPTCQQDRGVCSNREQSNQLVGEASISCTGSCGWPLS